MADKDIRNFVLLFQCEDKLGIVARISDFIYRRDGNIISASAYQGG